MLFLAAITSLNSIIIPHKQLKASLKAFKGLPQNGRYRDKRLEYYFIYFIGSDD
jgi:hypothetical protein